MLIHGRVADTVDFYSWILGWGEKIEVLEPRQVREHVINTAKRIVKVYDRR